MPSAIEVRPMALPHRTDADLIGHAARMAAMWHATGKPRKYTGLPYIVHPAEVAALATRAGLPPAAIAAAWLHDSVEDTGANIRSILTHFGAEVAGYVAYLTDVYTKEAFPELNRPTRKQLERERLAAGGEVEQGLKVCDMISNTTDIVTFDPDFARTYLEEKRLLLASFVRCPPELMRIARDELARAEHQLVQQSLAPV